MKKLCLLLALLLILNLCGCRAFRNRDTEEEERDDRYSEEVDDRVDDDKPREEQPEDQKEKKDPRQMLELTLQALTGGESGGAMLGQDGMPAIPQNTGVAKLLSSYVQFQVESLDISEDRAVATVTITAPDTPALLQQVMGELQEISQESLEAALQEPLKNNPPMVTNTVTIQLVLAEDVWCVVPDFALSNALTGGLTQAYQNAYAEMMKQMKGGEGA